MRAENSNDNITNGVPCMWMRGGTSKGAYFLAEHLPGARDAFLLRIMGSPDERQIDGMGGADPLTSKVAVVRKSAREDADVDYLFLQVAVDQALVSDKQNCGNILAGVAPFAIERGLVEARGDTTTVRIFMENTGQLAVATVASHGGQPVYSGEASIDGVPGSASPVSIVFSDTAGSTCGALLPSGNAVDTIEGVEVTMVDNGMPVVVLRASDFSLSGTEPREQLDANNELKTRLETIRMACGYKMNLGDVSELTVPKMTLVSAPNHGGTVSTRTFIPHRCHASIGVLGAVSVATACLLPGSPAHGLANVPAGEQKLMQIEHPIGQTAILANYSQGELQSAGVIRTTRKLFDGLIF